MIAATCTPTIVPNTVAHLSWSGLQDYGACPRKFFYRRIACVADETKSASLVFGGAIHRAIQSLYEAKLEGRKALTTKKCMGEYDAAWSADVSAGPELTFPKGDSYESLRRTAEGMLALYRKQVQHDRARILGIEHEALFRFVPEAPPIKARLDLLSVEGDALVVSDWKTAKCRWSEQKTRECLPQLVLYSFAMSGIARVLGLRRILPRFVVLTKGKVPAVQVLEPQATQSDVERLKERVRETADSISKGAFSRRESWQCGCCPFSRRCLGDAHETVQ
ncbi:MAG TPA: PD-(D/E)XK nuclease family protein [Planctomycetota bacterium]|jgi:hypothetical protein